MLSHQCFDLRYIHLVDSTTKDIVIAIAGHALLIVGIAYTELKNEAVIDSRRKVIGREVVGANYFN